MKIISEGTRVRDDIVRVGRSLFDRRLTPGATGNISVRLDDGTFVMTPTNVALGELDPALLSHVDAEGNLLGGEKPTKEAFLHTCMYCQRPTARAVVHLHSTNAVAVSLLDGVDASNVLPPLTPYYVMRVGRLPLIPYFPPGDRDLARAVASAARDHGAVLLANHGPVVAGATLRDAQHAAEELEETAKLFLLVRHERVRSLTEAEVEALQV